jgi:dihydropteroate synthase
MGVLNVTPDSFSDGGKFINADAAVNHGMSLSKAGADMLDIGGESTRPGAIAIGSDEEMNRIIPVIRGLRQRGCDTPISVDTYRADVARAAVEAGANMINDVSAGTWDSRMLSTIAEVGVPCTLMHTRGTPLTMQDVQHLHYKDVVRLA